MEDIVTKITLQHIIESKTEYCVICKERKGGKFTVFYIDRADDKFYFAVCRDCLQ